jgi:dTDP-4-dehydrorhamnose reductase
MSARPTPGRSRPAGKTTTGLKVAVTGVRGQVGRELKRVDWLSPLNRAGLSGVEMAGFDVTELDITDRRAVLEVMGRERPDVIVNAAAYTAVDRAEDEPEQAMAVNAVAVGHLAEAADHSDAMLVHISTDYVFDGCKDGWYTETDPPNPLGVYGRTKLAGEERALSANRSLVLRTAWVYGALGSNFVTTMLRLARERDEIAVVADQVGCPTAAADIAAAIVKLVAGTSGGRDHPVHRLYHLASPTAVSWFDLAKAVFATSRSGYGGVCRPLTTAQYPTRATRPANSKLDCTRLARDFGIELPPLETSLAPVVDELESAAEAGVGAWIPADPEQEHA